MVGFLAFFQRIVDRRGGFWSEAYGENLEARAQQYLPLLSLPTDSLRFKIALRNLARQYDLFSEDAVFSPSILELQAKTFQLAPSNEDAQAIALEQFTRPPISKLFSAIIRQASVDGFQEAQIDFRIDKWSKFPIFYLKEGSEPMEAMTIPKNLAQPLRGHALRVARAGYEATRPYMHEGNRLPKDVRFTWPETEVLNLTL